MQSEESNSASYRSFGQTATCSQPRIRSHLRAQFWFIHHLLHFRLQVAHVDSACRQPVAIGSLGPSFCRYWKPTVGMPTNAASMARCQSPRGNSARRAHRRPPRIVERTCELQRVGKSSIFLSAIAIQNGVNCQLSTSVTVQWPTLSIGKRL